jgi:hypothetical protein
MQITTKRFGKTKKRTMMMTLSPKIEAKVRAEVERFLTQLSTLPQGTDVSFSADGNNSLVIRAVAPPNLKKVQIIPAEMESYQRTVHDYVVAKGFPNLWAVYTEKVKKDVNDYAEQGIKVRQVSISGEKHPFRVRYMVKDEL